MMVNSKLRLLYVSLSISLVIFTQNAFAQTDITAQYLKAKEYLAAGDYEVAAKEFFNLRKNLPYSDFWAYNTYYAAYSYFKLHQYKDANFLLFQIIKEYPEWHNSNETFYLKGVVQMENRQYVDAFAQWEKMTDNSLRKEAAKAKQFYCNAVAIDTLKQLLHKFPDDKVLKKLLTKPENNLPKAQPNFLPLVNNRLDVAVLLPYELMVKNNFVFELYAGIQMAYDSLQKQGVPIELHYFDSGRDSAAIAQLLTKYSFAEFDLLIGPLYSEQQRVISDFALTNQVPVVNPLSHYMQPGSNHPFYFLSMPSYENMGACASDFAIQNFTRKPSSVIIYGNAQGDSLMAAAYKSTFESAGGKVLLYKQLTKNTASYFSTLIKKVPMDSLGHVFVAGADPSLAANVYTGLESVILEKAAAYKESMQKQEEEKKYSETGEEIKKLTVQDIPVITLAKWLSYTTITYDQINLHNTHFIFPDYVANQTHSKFSHQYTNTFGLEPTQYSYIGYETLLYFAHFTYKYGRNFPFYLPNIAPVQGVFMGYRDYTKSKSNSYVPIVQFQDNELKWVNVPNASE